MTFVREVSVIGMSIAAVLGYGRVFDDWSFLTTAVVFALASHAIALLGRRLCWSLLVTAVVSGVALVAFVGVTWFSETVLLGVIPTGETWQAFDLATTDAWSQFSEIVAPTEAIEGFAISLAIAAWFTAFLADWAAFRLFSPPEAIAPSALMWFVPALFAAQYEAALSVLYLVSVLVYVLVTRITAREASSNWLGESVRAGRAALLAGGLGCIVAIALGAIAIAPSVPGGDEESAGVAWRDIGDDSSGGQGVIRPTSPLVDVRSQLVDLAKTEVFTVATDDEDYWRLTSLDRFDDGVWTAGGTYARAAGELDSGLVPDQASDLRAQTFTIGALESVWIPAAYEPRQVSSSSEDLRYDEESGSLIVADGETSPSMRYEVVSEVPRRDENSIAGSSGNLPDEIVEGYLELPDDFSPAISALASEETSGAETPDEKALALLGFFHDNFEYNIDVDAGHGIDRMETFLEIREGYCEQFASTYAAMARSVALPSRVAVGYTSGEWDPEAGVFRVRGEHAHAWPEVYLADVGWVRFDATPTRGAPDDYNYTGVLPSQAGQTTPTTTPDPEASVAPPDASVTAPDGPATSQIRAAAGANGNGTSGGGDGGGLSTVAGWVLGIVVAAASMGSGLALVVRARRSRYLDPNRSSPVTASWRHVTSALALRGAHQKPTETPQEFARRIGRGEREGLTELAELITMDRFADRVSSESAARAGRLEQEMIDRVFADAAMSVRLRWWFDPRTVHI